jgi:hypothetical protein
MPNIHSIDEDMRFVFEPRRKLQRDSKTDREASAKQSGKSRHRENFFKPPLGNLIMNTKSFLIATLLAAASSVAFANEAAPAAQKTEAVQVAQANTGVRNMAPSARAGSNAMTASCANTYNEATSMIVCSNNDGRTRTQVREETRAWLNSPEGKASRAMYVGGAQ